ncbi:MAG TPA: PA domain-containing protein, partial [Bacteroidota bacterium]|nr:PA domain-containing protein [Bacteroidota bacterium]
MKNCAALALGGILLLPGAERSPAQMSAVMKENESRFDSSLSADSLRSWMKILTARPHHAGSPYGRANAEFIAARMKEWGFETSIETFEVLFPTPKSRTLELLEPRQYSANLAEPPLEADATSGQTEEQLPIYNAYSVDGDVTGELVYVNYGVPADYEELDRRGISVRGAIVIARYGGSWRGIKPKLAAENGAIGCIIYSDPRDDGYAQGDVYPVGPWRPKDGVQRGSVLDLPVAPGDPLTVGTGATIDAVRIERAAATTIMKIPVLPISYGDAQPLLAALGGPVVPDAWRGALPITYKMGPGPARVRLKAEFNWALTPVYNVVATLRGSDFPDEW